MVSAVALPVVTAVIVFPVLLALWRHCPFFTSVSRLRSSSSFLVFVPCLHSSSFFFVFFLCLLSSSPSNPPSNCHSYTVHLRLILSRSLSVLAQVDVSIFTGSSALPTLLANVRRPALSSVGFQTRPRCNVLGTSSAIPWPPTYRLSRRAKSVSLSSIRCVVNRPASKHDHAGCWHFFNSLNRWLTEKVTGWSLSQGQVFLPSSVCPSAVSSFSFVVLSVKPSGHSVAIRCT